MVGATPRLYPGGGTRTATGRGRSYRTPADRRYGVFVAGGAEMRKALKDSGDNLADLRKAHKEVAKIVKDKARVLVPVSNKPKNWRNASPRGSLRKSIRTSATKTSAELKSGWDSVAKSHGTVPYAGVIEYGWPARKIRAQPFMRLSVSSQLPAIRRIYNDGAAEALARAGLEVT